MKRWRGIIATDHVDISGERIPVKALRAMVESIKGSYTLVRVEHDVWRPPIGRGVSAILCKLKDGHFGIEVEYEMFEPTDDPSSYRSADLAYTSPFAHRGVAVFLDDTFQNDAGRTLSHELHISLNPDKGVRRHVKKYVVGPAEIVLIVAGFAGLKIAEGFLKKIGDDAYAAMKRAFATYFATPSAIPARIDYCFIMADGSRSCAVHVLFDNAADAVASDKLLRAGELLEAELPKHRVFDDGVVELVFEFRDHSLKFLYGVYSDCVPFPLSAVPELDLSKFGGLSIGMSVTERPADPGAAP